MNSRLLMIFSLVVVAAAGWFFHKQAQIAPPVTIKPSEVDFEATDIKAVQTNETGDREYELSADSISHNPQTNEDEMAGITMDWSPGAKRQYSIKAGSAAINQQSGELRLSGGFVLASKGDEPQVQHGATASQAITVTGETLFGNTKSRQVYSNDPVRVTQGDSHFEAASMTADLEAAEYEFGQVAVSFVPPDRQDAELF